MKIALITDSSNLKPNGRFHNVINRVNYLQKFDSVDLDVFLFRCNDDLFHRLLFKRKKMPLDEVTEIDGIKYRNLWLSYKFVDSVLSNVFGYRDIMCKSQIENFIPRFSSYDIILAHSIEGKYLAYKTKELFSIPYINGWHGSDLNIAPYKTKKKFQLHKQLINNADHNLFVSKKLLEKSNEFTNSEKRSVSYSGVSSSFFPFEKSTIFQLKEKYNLTNKYIIGYIGNFRRIKNVTVLPAIFKIVQDKLGDVGFVLVGDERGLYDKMKRLMNKLDVKNVLFMGKRDRTEIPKIMNCFDLLILPSLKEGLPLVTLEALACGVPVVGSKVGGIPEAIGEENTFELNNEFEKNISNRMVEILINNEKAKSLSDAFSWDKTIKDLVELCEKITSFKS